VGNGTDYLTSPPKEGMLRIFKYRKVQRLRPSLNPQTQEPEASMRSTRPPKPSCRCVGVGERNYVCESKGKIALRMGGEAVSLGQCFLLSQWNVVPSLSGDECS
jgi:hypothetical protein